MTFLNAGVFLVLGEDLFFLRIPLFVLFLPFVPCIYYIARQFVRPLGAAFTSAAAVTWGLPVYPAAVPSWSFLLFTVYGAAALTAWRKSRRDRWLVIAGAFGGLAIAFKIVGIYFIAAAVLFLICAGPRLPRERWISVVLPIGALIFADGVVLG